MYIDTRRTSACQSVASASRDFALTQLAYHCRPCVLMPRNWIGWLYWLHRWTPQTCSCPLIAAGVWPGAGGGGPAGSGRVCAGWRGGGGAGLAVDVGGEPVHVGSAVGRHGSGPDPV